jgi:hypothetical protein
MPNVENKKIVLAVQGSFGHIFYATGILDAFRAYNSEQKAKGEKSLNAIAGSGCVEMLMPLALYLAAQDAETSMCDNVLDCDKNLPLLAQQDLAPPAVRLDAWQNYFSGLFKAQATWAKAGLNLATHTAKRHRMMGAGRFNFNSADPTHDEDVATLAKMTAASQNLFMYSSGLPGQTAFNPFSVAAKLPGLAQLYAAKTGPTLFTNATRADDFSEIYLYSGAAPDAAQKLALTGKANRRQLLRLTADNFFPSGARPPYLAPMPVEVDGKTQHWMEGAMRCNPPLAPLIDMGATHIVLIRFFSKDNRAPAHNNAEMNERFLDAMFSIPLQKEIESIEFNNQLAQSMAQVPAKTPIAAKLRDRRQVTIIDPADHDNPAFSPAYNQFLNTELNALSHYSMGDRQLQKQMTERGIEIGESLIKHLQAFL